jgi:hypothetical protein
MQVEKRQGYCYEHAFSHNWNAMQGYHSLMRLAHLFNALALATRRVAKQVRESCAQRGLRLEWLHHLGACRCNCGSNSEHGASLSERISKASEGRARRGVSAFWRVLKKSPSLSCMATSVGTKITAHKDRAGDSCLAIVGKSDLDYFMRQS